MEYVLKILLLTQVALLNYAAPAENGDKSGVETAGEYFRKYGAGYSANGLGAARVASTENARLEMSLEENPLFLDRVVNFQVSADIEPTGVVNEETLEKMKESRCGVPDPVSDPNGPGKYEVQSRWWSKKNSRTGLYVMTYSYTKKETPDDLKFHSFRKGVTLAMCQWELISNVRFRFIGIAKKKADIVISYEKGNHGDGYSFDGRGGTLGHAFYPEDGRVHLDLEEPWYLASSKLENQGKKDVYTAALHELGHTIGLLHSKDRQAIMAPFYRYRGLFRSFDMPNDEKSGVQDMYGKRIDSNPATERFSACRDARRRYKIDVSPTTTVDSTEATTEDTFEEVPCEDDPFHTKLHCKAWKARKLCEVDIFATTMHKRCKKTCGFCPESKKATKAGQLTSKSICNIKSYDSFMTTYDETNGFSAVIFKDNYYFKMQVALMSERYSTHSLLNQTEDITGTYKFDLDPRSIAPGLFKIQTPNFLYKTSKADASVFDGKRYFTFEGTDMHLYQKDVTGAINYDTTYEVDKIFYGFNASKVDAVHAAVNQTDDTVTFTLFSGCNMWQYKEYRDRGNGTLIMIQMLDKIDVNISNWHGIPACSVDSIFEYRGIPYFLKGNIFWPATISEPQVPRDITYNFFRCWETEPANIEIPPSDGGSNGVSGQHIASTFSVIFAILISHLTTKFFS